MLILLYEVRAFPYGSGYSLYLAYAQAGSSLKID